MYLTRVLSMHEILSRIAQTTAALTWLKLVWNDWSISLSSKIRLMRSLVTSILIVCLRVVDPQSRAAKKNAKYGNEVLPQDTTHLVQKSCYQRGSPFQDPAGNRTNRRSPDYRKEKQTEVVWTCLPFISPSKPSCKAQ